MDEACREDGLCSFTVLGVVESKLIIRRGEGGKDVAWWYGWAAAG